MNHQKNFLLETEDYLPIEILKQGSKIQHQVKKSMVIEENLKYEISRFKMGYSDIARDHVFTHF